MLTREEQRHDLAKQVCRLPYSRLMEWGLTRAADLTGLDTIGLPIYTVCRPPGMAITISAGKGLTRIDSMAGAILEGVELWASENPERHPNWAYCSYSNALSSFTNVLPFELFQLARSAPVTKNTVIEWDEMTDFYRERTTMVPSEMIWLKSRIKPPFQFFQSSSSGLAAGMSEIDAILQGTYEVVERDGWAISEFVQDCTGQWRECISLDCPLHPSLQHCVDRLKAAGVHPFIFDLNRDLGVPIFRCTILDPDEQSPGSFSGFGCSLDPITACRRAITEACQARAAYIGGARDDLFRRKFLMMKKVQMDRLLELYQSLKTPRTFSTFTEKRYDSVESEWETLSSLLKEKISELFYKTIYVSTDPNFWIVKVICPELECPIWEHYATGKRAMQAIQ